MDGPVGSRDARVAELLEEFLAAASAGTPISREAFLAANPDGGEELGAALRALEFVGRAGEDLPAGAATAQAAPPPTGTLGDFRLIREVGRGGMGIVYEAVQVSLGRRVALKVLPFASVLDSRQLQRFKHEAQAAALLHHTNIVPIHAVGTERGVHYYAMEFIEGRTLAAVVQELRATKRSGSAEQARNRRPSPRRKTESAASSAEVRALAPDSSNETPDYCRAVAKLGLHAAEALEHAHEQGVVHRDIKPANLMIDADARLWITDFGLAKSRGNANLTMTGAIVGTLGYMSPEQALGKHVVLDHRADIYSLGVTLIETLTLEPTFPGDDPRTVIQDIAFKAPTSPRRLNAAVPPALETILLKAVAKDPESRYATAQDMADDLRRFLANEPIHARRAPAIDRVSLWAKRHRAAVAAGVGVLVVAVAALAVELVHVGAARRDTADALEASRASAARAQTNLAKAEDAIDRMLTQVGSKQLQGLPGLEPVRRKLLEDAANLYEELVRGAGDDATVRRRAAAALRRVAWITNRFGDVATAERLCVRGRDLLVAIAPEDGPWRPELGDLAYLEQSRARILRDGLRTNDALLAAEHAVALGERCVRERPDDAASAATLADGLVTYGEMLTCCGRLPEACDVLHRAVASLQTSVDRTPADAERREQLGTAFCLVGRVEQLMGRCAEAESSWRKALRELEPATRAPPDSDAFDHRAQANVQLADLLMTLGRYDEAVPLLIDAADARASQSAQFPRYAAANEFAADARGRLAVAYFHVGRVDDAESVLLDAFERYDRFLAEFKDGLGERSRAAGSLARLGPWLAHAGRHAEADVAYRRAAGLSRAIAVSAPGATDAKARLAQAICNWTRYSRWRMPFAERVDLCQEAVAAATDATSHPDAAPADRRTMAIALCELGNCLSDANDFVGASNAFRRASEILQTTARESGVVTADRQEFTNVLRAWGECSLRAGDLDDAALRLRESRSLAEQLLAGSPNDPNVQYLLACALHMMSEVEERQNRLNDAEVTAQNAIRVLDTLPVGYRAGPEASYVHASSLLDLGIIQRRANRPADAERTLRTALAELRAFDAGFRGAQQRADTCCQHLAALLFETGRGSEAEPYLQESVRHCEAVVTAWPDARSRRDLLFARCYYAQQMTNLGRLAEAEREARAALDAAAGFPGDERGANADCVSGAMFLVAVACTSTGRHREAVEMLERAFATPPYLSVVVNNLVIALTDVDDPSVRNPRRAVEVAKEALAHVPAENSGRSDLVAKDVWGLLGLALFSDERWEDARSAYAKAHELGWDDECSYPESIAAAKVGDLDAARRLYDRANTWFATNAANLRASTKARAARWRAAATEALAEAEKR
jgi:serine/threonine protein kinase/tetratricopeptide (TPR) repeat protein